MHAFLTKPFIHRKRLLAASFLAIATIITPTAMAAEPGKESITLSPASQRFKLDRGAKQSGELTVVNDGTTSYTFLVYAKPYSVNDVEYTPDFYTVRTNTDLERWISFPAKSYVLGAGKSITVPYTISVPPDAVPGGHYGAIFAETQPADAINGTSVQRKKRVGSLLYVTVNGDFKTAAKFNPIRIAPLQFKAPLRSELTTENTGDTDFEVKTIFQVEDLFGHTKYHDEKTYQLLPKTKRLLALEWTKSPGFGFYKVTVSAAQLDQTTSETSYVLMAPIAFYMVFVVGLFALIIYLVQKRR